MRPKSCIIRLYHPSGLVISDLFVDFRLALPPTPFTTCSIAHVMSGKRAGDLLRRVKSAGMAVVNAPQRERRNNAGAKGGIPSPMEALRVLVADCTWPKVFGTPEGVLPARQGPPRPTKGEEVGCVPRRIIRI